MHLPSTSSPRPSRVPVGLDVDCALLHQRLEHFFDLRGHPPAISLTKLTRSSGNSSGLLIHGACSLCTSSKRYCRRRVSSYGSSVKCESRRRGGTSDQDRLARARQSPRPPPPASPSPTRADDAEQQRALRWRAARGARAAALAIFHASTSSEASALVRVTRCKISIMCVYSQASNSNATASCAQIVPRSSGGGARSRAASAAPCARSLRSARVRT